MINVPESLHIRVPAQRIPVRKSNDHLARYRLRINPEACQSQLPRQPTLHHLFRLRAPQGQHDRSRHSDARHSGYHSCRMVRFSRNGMSVMLQTIWNNTASSAPQHAVLYDELRRQADDNQPCPQRARRNPTPEELAAQPSSSGFATLNSEDDDEYLNPAFQLNHISYSRPVCSGIQAKGSI